MLIDRNDEVINICEIKYSSDEYAITDAYEETLRKRASLFKKVTKTKKALQHTSLYMLRLVSHVDLFHDFGLNIIFLQALMEKAWQRH